MGIPQAADMANTRQPGFFVAEADMQSTCTRQTTVEPLYCGHLGNPVKCPVQRGVLISGHIWDIAKCP